MGALALRFAVLTAARCGEVRLATWPEIDADDATWTIPAERMKVGREHRMPLSAPTLAILAEARPHARGDPGLIFPGHQRDRPLSDITLAKALKRIRIDATPHRFRSSATGRKRQPMRLTP